MVITRQVLAKQLSDYLHHNVTIEQLVDWADVRAFGLTWEDCEGFLSRLGYRARIDVFQST